MRDRASGAGMRIGNWGSEFCLRFCMACCIARVDALCSGCRRPGYKMVRESRTLRPYRVTSHRVDCPPARFDAHAQMSEAC